jgi:hypothetical protein
MIHSWECVRLDCAVSNLGLTPCGCLVVKSKVENHDISGEHLAMTTFASTLDAADQLTLEEQEELAATLRRRIAERRRDELVQAVREARAEYARGRIKPASATEIARLIRS